MAQFITELDRRGQSSWSFHFNFFPLPTLRNVQIPGSCLPTAGCKRKNAKINKSLRTMSHLKPKQFRNIYQFRLTHSCEEKLSRINTQAHAISDLPVRLPFGLPLGTPDTIQTLVCAPATFNKPPGPPILVADRASCSAAL